MSSFLVSRIGMILPTMNGFLTIDTYVALAVGVVSLGQSAHPEVGVLTYVCEACLKYLPGLPTPSYRQYHRRRNLRHSACSSGGVQWLTGGGMTGLVTRASYQLFSLLSIVRRATKNSSNRGSAHVNMM